MRKFLLYFTVIALVSCSSDDGGDKSVDKATELLLGQWNVVSESAYNSKHEVLKETSLRASVNCPFDVLFYENGGKLSFTSYTVRSEDDPYCDDSKPVVIGKWQLQSKRKLGINNNGVVRYFTIVELGKTRMVLERSLSPEEVIFGNYPEGVSKIRILYTQ